MHQVIKKIYVSQANFQRNGWSFSIFDLWRFIRASNTEPLVRLNLETKGDKILLKEKQKSLPSSFKNYDLTW